MTFVITPISKAYKRTGSQDSKRDYEDQQARVSEGSEWMWDDAKGNKSVVGGIFGFAFNGDRIEFHRITRVADPTERLPLWAENVGQGHRRVLFLSARLYSMPWKEWLSHNGMRKVQGSNYPRGMDIPLLERLVFHKYEFVE